MKPKDLRDEYMLAALPAVIEAMAADRRDDMGRGVRWDGAHTFEEGVAINTAKVVEAMMVEREKPCPYWYDKLMDNSSQMLDSETHDKLFAVAMATLNQMEAEHEAD